MPLLEPSPGSLPLNAGLRFLPETWRKSKIVGRYAFVQAVVQGIGFLSGILLVRLLSQREYASFTIANTMQGTLNMLGDIGISIGLISIGGRVWSDRSRFSQLIVTALYLRRRLVLLAAVVITPILFYMLLRNGAGISNSLILILFILLGLIFQLNLGVLSVVPRLRSEVSFLQRLDFLAAVFRLIGLLLLALTYLRAQSAIALATLTFFLQNLLLRRYCRTKIDFEAPVNDSDRKAMLGIVRGQAANAIFFSLQGQITIFLLGIFGARFTAVAEVGALGRLAMIFTILTNLMNNIFVPAFARCQSLRRARRIYLEVILAVAGFCLIVLAAAALAPGQFLFILGAQYAHLQPELLWMAMVAVLNALISTLFVLNAAKGWVQGSWFFIPLTLISQICLIPFTNFGDVRSVLIFSFISNLPTLALYLVLMTRGFEAWSRSEAPA